MLQMVKHYASNFYLFFYHFYMTYIYKYFKIFKYGIQSLDSQLFILLGHSVEHYILWIYYTRLKTQKQYVERRYTFLNQIRMEPSKCANRTATTQRI